MLTRVIAKIVVGLAIIVVTADGAQVWAETRPGETTARSEPALEVSGFRSAQFGMAETAVRAAIAKDFPVQAKTIASETNPVEKTTALSLTVDDLVPESGPARISYILGYKSKALIQVNITWGAVAPGVAAAAPETLVNTAAQLSNYLSGAGYSPDSIVSNAVLPGGSLVVFRGNDSKGRMTLLAMRGRNETVDKVVQFTPNQLQLSYVADPRNPDVFRLEKGKF